MILNLIFFDGNVDHRGGHNKKARGLNWKNKILKFENLKLEHQL